MPNTLTTSTGVTLSRDAFITHYTAAWLAASSVHRYWHMEAGTCADDQPVEDAVFCAERAWEQLATTKL